LGRHLLQTLAPENFAATHIASPDSIPKNFIYGKTPATLKEAIKYQ
jgi:hypothetical protein